MKKYNIFSLFLMLMVVFTGCKKDDIIFEIEQPQFETREGYMLFEVIMPYDTDEEEEIYMIGDFNGGEEAIGNPKWLMTRGPGSTVTQSKWGIYLDPSSFEGGKTLADGYTFYSIQNGEARTLENTPAIFTEYPQVGGRQDVFVYFWATHFDKPQKPDEVEHDGYAIYVINNAGWDLHLWAWSNDQGNIMGEGAEWPGLAVTGQIEIDGTTYSYFDTGADHEGWTVNIILSNNGSPQTPSPDPVITLNQDYYFELTADGTLVQLDGPAPAVEHDGSAIFVYNPLGWDLFVWAWPDGGDGSAFLGVDWPGKPMTGTQTINGVVYEYYDFGQMNDGQTINVIVSNNGSDSERGQVDGITLNKNYYYEISAGKLTPIEDPSSFTPGGATEPVPEPEPEPDEPLASAEYRVYIQNETSWDNLYLYAYNGGENLYGAWPGMTFDKKVTIDGVEYLVYPLPATMESATLIFNNNDGTQVEQSDMVVTLDQNWYIQVTDTKATFLEVPEISIYVDNQTGWDAFALYSWGSGDTFGGWPGAVSNTTESINGVDYIIYKAPATGKEESLIFNNNDGGTQLPDFPVTLNEDVYLLVTSEGVQFANE